MTRTTAPRDTTMAQIAYDQAPATENRKGYILDLLARRDLTGTPFDGWTPDWSRATNATASQVITRLKALPYKRTDSTLPDVPAGHYALEDAAGAVKFYEVDRPTQGRWAGRTFLSACASDERHPIKNPASRAAVLAEIALDPRTAMMRYGQEIGKCGHCGRTLTDAESRARGIGPVCMEKI